MVVDVANHWLTVMNHGGSEIRLTDIIPWLAAHLGPIVLIILLPHVIVPAAAIVARLQLPILPRAVASVLAERSFISQLRIQIAVATGRLLEHVSGL